MKKGFLAIAVVAFLSSCGNGNVSETNGTSEESTTDSANINMGSQAPIGDTANQINNRAGSFPADSNNQNGDDSVKGSNPASRGTTPGNDDSSGNKQ